MPQALAMLALWLSNGQWVTPFYLIMTGVSSAIASTLATALWVQLFGPAQLARVRSAVEAGTVIASGASPVIMGVLIDNHVTLHLQALFCPVYILAPACWPPVSGRMRRNNAPLPSYPSSSFL
ncbi:hypothetical protein [Klebsiella pneumoniae]|uniref:hypothetical protein n=1 Tax=Klebsiella pneumoniae TaxID=573 RepID=UPI001D0DBA27|nr:hypothetical protein [Klebsiella pneumoniae]